MLHWLDEVDIVIWWDNIIQLLTGFENNSSFVRPKDKSVARSRRLICYKPSFFRKCLLFYWLKTPIHSHVHLPFLLTSILLTTTGIVMIMWLVELMKIRPSVNSLIAGNRSMNCWPVNRIMLQRVGNFCEQSKCCGSIF